MKNTRTYDEDYKLKAYVLTLQKFEKLLKQGVEDGSVSITESYIETDNIFELWNGLQNLLMNYSVLFLNQ